MLEDALCAHDVLGPEHHVRTLRFVVFPGVVSQPLNTSQAVGIRVDALARFQRLVCTFAASLTGYDTSALTRHIIHCADDIMETRHAHSLPGECNSPERLTTTATLAKCSGKSSGPNGWISVWFLDRTMRPVRFR